MKNFIKLFLLFILSTMLHWACASIGAELGIGVNLIFVFAFTACLFINPIYGYTFAFMSGLFLDSFGTQMFGVYGLTFVLLARVSYFLAKNMDFSNILTQMVSVFLLSILGKCFYFLAGIIFLKGISGWMGFGSLFFSAFANAILAPFMFYLFKSAGMDKGDK